MDNRFKPNVRSKYTGNIEIRKLWDIPNAKYIWGFFEEVLTETCEMVGEGADQKPNWDNLTSSELGWTSRQGFVGDEEWAKTNAEHFGIEFPTEEYKAPEG